MRNFILPIALVSAACAFAAEVELHGAVNVDYGSYFDSDFDPKNAANQDIDLVATAFLDEDVSVTVMANTHSSYMDSTGDNISETRRHDFARSTAIDDDDARWTAFNFGGVQLRWDVTHAVGIIFGDLTYSAGSFNYYYWRDPGRYAVITREETLRGVGAEFGNDKYGKGKVYFGASDNTLHTAAIYASYGVPLLNKNDEHLVLTPSVDWMFGDEIGRGYTYVLGTEVDYSKSYEKLNWGIYAVWGLHPYKGKGVHSFLVEPSFNYSIFNLGMSYFYAITDEDYAAADQIFTDDQKMFSVEPSFNLHKKLTLGVSYEYHDPDDEVHGDDYHFLGMNFYVYPTMRTEVVFWYGYNFSDNIDTDFAMGISGRVDF